MTRETFRCNARRMILTFPQCPLAIQVVYDELAARHPIKWARICIENHEDGNPHLHVAVEWKNKIDIKSASALDIEGYHCNIQSSKNWGATKNYVKKGENFLDFDNNDEEESNTGCAANVVLWAAELPYNCYLEKCLDAKVPFAYALEFWKAKTSIHTITSRPTKGTMLPHVSSIIMPTSEQHSVVITGPSGCGKTTWALTNCELPTLFVTHMDILRQFEPNLHQSIIFDDMSFSHLPREAQIHLVDRTQTNSIHVRYTTASIPAGTQKIFTSNVPIFTEDDAIDRRITKIKIY